MLWTACVRFGPETHTPEAVPPLGADAAITSFDALADNSSLPDSLRDLAKLQSAIVLLDSQGSLQDIELRLDALLDDDNGLQPMARETMALAYMVNDKPLKARELFKAQIGDARVIECILKAQHPNFM